MCASHRCNGMTSSLCTVPVKDGEGSEAEVINRFSQSPHWGWSAVAPESKVFWVVDMGERILAIVQSVVHQLVDV